MKRMQIKGGAEPAVVAAVSAAVQALLDAEAAAASRPSSRPEPTNWALAARYGQVDRPRYGRTPSVYSDPLR